MSIDASGPYSRDHCEGLVSTTTGACAARLIRVDVGERMLIWCEGGPSIGRAVHFPPPCEIAVEGGMYVLVDEGSPEHWHYEFVSEADLAR